MPIRPTPETCLDEEFLAEILITTGSFPGRQSVGSVFDHLSAGAEGFFGIEEDGRFLGLISKAQIGMLLSGRFGYALYAKHPIREHLLADSEIVMPGESLLEVLSRAFKRAGAAFHYDLAAVDSGGRFFGIVPMPTLVRLQNEIIAEQTRRAAEQGHTLQHRELQLFRSQERLRQSEGRFGILFENSPLGFALLDTTGRIEACNRRLAEMLGSEAADFTATVTPDDQPAVTTLLQGFEKNLEGEPPRTMELRLERLGSDTRMARCDFHWIQETGQICLCVQDITAQRRLEQRLQQKEKSAMLDTLAGGIAHELNNKLLPVLGYAEMVQLRAAAQSELKPWCEIIRQSTVEAAELVGQLLQLSRPPAIEPRLCDLAAIVRASLGILRFRLREADCEPDLDLPAGPALVLGDPAQLKQVLVNLCLNALDAMSTREQRRLHLSLVQEDQGICLRLRDTGVGIAAEHRARIFDPFFTTKGAQQGTGLGLSVCFSIVQQHSGTIEVESSGPDGTVFALWLPTVNDTPAQAETGAEAPAGLAARPHTGEPIVLVVDDEEFITSLVHEALRTHLGCQVFRASSVDEALAHLGLLVPDLIISDVRMPGRNGLDLHSEVQRRWPRLIDRFFFITGDSGSQELTAALFATGCPVLRKPFSMEKLAVQAAAILGAQPAATPGGNSGRSPSTRGSRTSIRSEDDHIVSVK